VFFTGEEREGKIGRAEERDGGRFEDGMAVKSEERRDSDQRVA
jgi:hypothetical protein